MTRLFFISSSGSMATHWLSEVLSASSSIKCFHGSYGIQKRYDPNLDVVSALQLMLDWGKANGIPIVGMNHLSMNHGSRGYHPCLNNGVSFCALVRNPILAADSQFQQRVKSEHLSDIKMQRYKAMIQLIDGMDGLVDTSSRAELIFFRCVESVIGHLSDIEANDFDFFKFEDYTVNYSEFCRLTRVITNNSVQDDHNINIAFSSRGKTNTHRTVKAGPRTTWTNYWSARQRIIFSRIWEFYAGQSLRQRNIYPEVNELLANSRSR